tara:strand:- start:194 stop:319 length:126 start_codon:yes stop_codon:yes gene_type:complete
MRAHDAKPCAAAGVGNDKNQDQPKAAAAAVGFLRTACRGAT